MKNKKILTLISMLIISGGLLSACGLLGQGNTQQLVQTAVLQTLSVQETQAVLATVNTILTQMAQTPEATATLLASSTPLPTNTLFPTSTPQPTATYVPCDWVQYISDITIPDGATLPASSSFKKTWRLRNIGSCTWTTSYALVFASGDAMNAPSSVSLPQSVPPGGTIDITVPLVAPEKSGTYQGFFKLKNANGATFGIGANTQESFWVKIKVQPSVPTSAHMPYIFSNNFCSATWKSEAGTVSCPAADNSFGYPSVTKIHGGALEGGYGEDEDLLITVPNNSDTGWIAGYFPKFEVETGDRFVTTVGCLDGNSKCEVMFSLWYKIGSDSEKKLQSWYEKSDGSFTNVDINLSALAGEKVTFILQVEAYGSAKGDRAFWLVPHIRR